jgi:hypothetical protein
VGCDALSLGIFGRFEGTWCLCLQGEAVVAEGLSVSDTPNKAESQPKKLEYLAF